MKYLLVVAVLAASVLIAHGELFGFYAITSNDSSLSAPSVGESQLHVDMAATGKGQVSFVFKNTGPEDSVISNIYFDFAPELNLRLSAIHAGPGVAFQVDSVKPKNLPGGRGMDNVFISDLGVSAKKPSPKNGLNPCDSLELIMDYDSSYDLLGALENNDLRIGLHVQGFAGGYSESFVNLTPTVPEPGTIPLLLIGGFVLRRLKIR